MIGISKTTKMSEQRGSNIHYLPKNDPLEDTFNLYALFFASHVE